MTEAELMDMMNKIGNGKLKADFQKVDALLQDNHEWLKQTKRAYIHVYSSENVSPKMTSSNGYMVFTADARFGWEIIFITEARRQIQKYEIHNI